VSVAQRRAGGPRLSAPGRTRRCAAGVLALALAAAGCGGAPGPGAGSAASPSDGGEPAASSGSENAPSGPKAPDFSLPTLDGGQISLSDYRGDKVVLIDFWSTTCDPCLREMPELVKLYQANQARGFEVLAISVDGPETQAAVPSKVKSTGMIFPVLLDEDTEVIDRYNPKGEMPFTLLVDRNGTIVLKRSGYQPGDAASMKKLTDAIEAALGS